MCEPVFFFFLDSLVDGIAVQDDLIVMELERCYSTRVYVAVGPLSNMNTKGAQFV